MKVGLMDVDGHNYPNLPLVKLSAWHKTQGDSVEWYKPMISEHLDIANMHKEDAREAIYKVMVYV